EPAAWTNPPFGAGSAECESRAGRPPSSTANSSSRFASGPRQKTRGKRRSCGKATASHSGVAFEVQSEAAPGNDEATRGPAGSPLSSKSPEPHAADRKQLYVSPYDADDA